MPVQELRVVNYGRGVDRHMWTVADVSIRGDIGIPSRRLPEWDVWFKRFSDIGPAFLCDCTSAGSIAPGGVPPRCEHMYTVFTHITRVKGPWEDDRVLMEKAWEMVSGRKREKPDLKVRWIERRPTMSALAGEKYSFAEMFEVTWDRAGLTVIKESSGITPVYICRCGEDMPCDHILAVMDFEKNETPPVITKGPWAIAPVYIEKDIQRKMRDVIEDEARKLFSAPFTNESAYIGIDPAAKKTESTYGSTSGTYSDRDGTFNQEELEKAKKALAEMNGTMKLSIKATDEAADAAWKFVGVMKELDVLKASIKNDSEKPKEPEEPKKPKSRFSEIDL